MEVIKHYDEESGLYIINLKEKDLTLEIYFAGNLDLYWFLKPIPQKDEAIELEVTKENYEIYQIFNELFLELEHPKIHTYDESESYLDFYFCETEEEKNKFYLQKQKEIDDLNEAYKNTPAYKKLYNNGVISWMSDNSIDGEKDNIVHIYKDEESIKLKFELYQNKFQDKSIRFSNSGSRYDPFNIIFMNMFNKLQNYDTKYHQIHIEEYLYSKNKVKKK